MPRRKYTLSGYRGMWLFAMFDLPVKTRKARRRYAQFRTHLLRQGFSMLQFSVYARYCTSEEVAQSLKMQIRARIPSEGAVRLLAVTDRQFGKMENYIGKVERKPERAPAQLELF